MYYTIFAKREENFLAKIDVAPLAGARIEICQYSVCCGELSVAPLAGARIEILNQGVQGSSPWSLPSRERGLKFRPKEIGIHGLLRRSPRGSAD